MIFRTLKWALVNSVAPCDSNASCSLARRPHSALGDGPNHLARSIHFLKYRVGLSCTHSAWSKAAATVIASSSSERRNLNRRRSVAPDRGLPQLSSTSPRKNSIPSWKEMLAHILQGPDPLRKMFFVTPQGQCTRTNCRRLSGLC